ncbi:heparinase II/III-family protein [Niabella sp. CC-SYL272]|uniref:heparinase II/III domain-containing protein n=1 Tax=Niabella agricola TaxID=2891571 RepID=UPI001F2B8491|nr:heparinase II/III family protein [Niabella agricola]MCF3110017.1 heparinase II/III-family protein [Niabella agricola]
MKRTFNFLLQGRVNALLLLTMLVPGTSFAYVKRDLLQKQANVQQVKNMLLPREQWIPYPAYKDRAGWDRLTGSYKNAFIEKGNAALTYQWKVIKATDYLEYTRSGSRVIMETPLNENVTTIVNLFTAELAEGKGRYLDQLANGVFAACEMTSWALSAHLSLQSSKIGFPDHREQVIDLMAGDMGSLFAWIYYYFHDDFKKINPLLELRLKKELEDRILIPYMNTDHLWWMALRYKPGALVNNWNPWCNSNVLQTFALIEDDPEKLARAVYRTMMSVDQFINYTNEDGACEEGPSYWGHAAGKLYDYLQLLYDITGGKISLFGEPIIKNMGTYISRAYVGNGWVVNFADASAKLYPDAPLIYRYGKAVNSTELMQLAALIRSSRQDGPPAAGRDAYRLFQTLRFDKELAACTAAHNTPAFTWYPQTEVCFMKQGALFFAAKGGHNNESHNHNDVGSFNLYINDMPVFIDAGVGTYTRQTFGPGRYSIWTMQSGYHNIPVINGYEEKNGATYKAGDVQFDARTKTFSLNISNAYPDATRVTRWLRSYRLSDGQLEISDAFSIDRPEKENRIHFLCYGTIKKDAPGKILIQQENGNTQLTYNSRDFEAVIETVPQEDARLSAVWGKQIYRIVLTARKLQRSGTYVFRIRRL